MTTTVATRLIKRHVSNSCIGSSHVSHPDSPELRKTKIPIFRSAKSIVHNPRDPMVLTSFSPFGTSHFMKLEDLSPPFSRYPNSQYLPGQLTVQISTWSDGSDQITSLQFVSSYDSAFDFSMSRVSEMLISRHVSSWMDDYDDFGTLEPRSSRVPSRLVISALYLDWSATILLRSNDWDLFSSALTAHCLDYDLIVQIFHDDWSNDHCSSSSWAFTFFLGWEDLKCFKGIDLQFTPCEPWCMDLDSHFPSWAYELDTSSPIGPHMCFEKVLISSELGS